MVLGDPTSLRWEVCKLPSGAKCENNILAFFNEDDRMVDVGVCKAKGGLFPIRSFMGKMKKAY